MLSPLRNRFGIPGVISVIALVFAMFGGAYAATNTGGKATTSAKKGPRGPKGPKGATGPAGPQGPAGAAGAKGDTGAAGSNGSPGVSATTTSFNGSKGTCNKGQGGLEVKSASPVAYVCNGEEGVEGPEGKPWTDGGTLPSGATLTGVWGQQSNATNEGRQYFPISFEIPLSAAPEPIFVAANEGSKPGCPGRGGAGGGEAETLPATGEYKPTVPRAAPGKLCVYASIFEEAEFEFFVNTRYEEGWSVELGNGENGRGASPTGTIMQVFCISELCASVGTWAVTAP